MALKPTIYRFKIALSDLNRNHYDTLALTVAQHPSETVERMMVRVLVYCLNAGPELSFTKGLSSVDEPAIWARTLTDRIVLWIEVGEPGVDRIKRASRRSDETKVYTFNTKSGAWWSQNQAKLNDLDVTVYRFIRDGVVEIAKLAQRKMELSVTVSEDSIYVAAELGECDVRLEQLSM